MKNTWKNHVYLWKLCFKTAPGFMCYTIFDAFRYSFMIFLEHCLGIRYVLSCAEHGEPFYKPLLFIGMILVLMMILMIPDGYYIHAMTFRAKPKLYQALKEDMYQKAADLDLACYDDPNYYNDFVLAVAEAETSIERFLTLLKNTTQSLTVLFTTGIFYLVTDAVGILFVLASFLLSFFMSKALNKLRYKVRLEVNPWERKRNYAGRVFYLNDYAKELRLHPEIGGILKKEFADANEEIYGIQKKISKKRVVFSFLRYYLTTDFILDGLYITYLIFQAAVFHRIDYSTAVILFNRTGDLRGGLRGLAEIAPAANENSLYIDKIRAFLAYEPKIQKRIGIAVPEGVGEICVKNMSFSYREDSEEILHDINMTIHPGERVAIVGYNGAGKTTLIKLLMRLYDPSKGTITYHGNDVREYDPEEYHKRIGVVFQDFKMYGASLYENVVLDDLPATKESEEGVVWALKKGGFAERLATLPNGLQTAITTEFDENGVNLSGGEGQKVAIARAFYRKADILAMDEPSSALDPIAEYNLNKAMHEAAEGKTVFYISHRLSTTRDADRIFMLEKGRIIEEGTHEELLEKNGKYAQMWHAQAGKYTEQGCD